MSGRSAHTRRSSQEPNHLMRTPERGMRSLSHGDDTPRPTGMLQGASPNTATGNDPGSPISSQSTFVDQQLPHPPKRLGFLGEKLGEVLGEKLLSSSSGSSSTQRGTPVAPQLLPARSHSRAESALPFISRETTSSPTPGMSAPTSGQPKGHTSPSKPSHSRNYDHKLVSREMHRLGNFAHLPSLNPSLSGSSSSSMAPTASTSNATSISSNENPWASLHVHLLPLFNGEPLRRPIEDLNTLVKRHIQSVVSSAPQKALFALEHDASDLIASGMVTLNAKLSGIDDDKLVNRVVEMWGFFWDQVLPYVEGALLPLQTEPLLSSLYRVPKAHKSGSPVHQNGKGSVSGLNLSKSTQIDVRTIALQLFRDKIIYPAFPVLNARLLAQRESAETPNYQQPRLQQMLLVLVSQRPLPSVLSINEFTPPPTPGEAAIQHLLRAIRSPVVQLTPHIYKRYSSGAPSFLSAGRPRDRRGRIAQKGVKRDLHEEDEEGEGFETPKLGGAFVDALRERDRELLESLRSPVVDNENARMSMGGWGLGAGGEEKKVDDEEDEDNLDWDQAQAVVERMVGMKSESQFYPEGRRRMT